MDRRLSTPRWLGFSSKLGSDQISNQSTWGRVPDGEMTMAACHEISCVPRNGSTTTYVNRLDPSSDPQQIDWSNPPGGFGEQNVQT